MPKHNMAVSERNGAALVVPVGREIPPTVHVLRVEQRVDHYHGAIVDAVLMLLDESENLAGVGKLTVLRLVVR